MRFVRVLASTGAVALAGLAGCEQIAGLGRACDYVDLRVPGTLINVGQSVRFKAWVQDRDPYVDCGTYEGEGITWRSSDRSVADVSDDGWVYGTSPGRAEIVAINDRSGRRASVTVTVVRGR